MMRRMEMHAPGISLQASYTRRLRRSHMLNFVNDYSEGAHEKILQRLLETNYIQTAGYGEDEFCWEAAEKIKAAFSCPDAEITFLAGGTQTNQIVISTLLRPYEGVIAAESGHVSLHEAGAIEYTGHKVMALPGHDGKLDAGEVDAFVRTFYADENHEHMVFPGMVYISHPTEYGTLYTRAELTALHEVCKSHGIPLYMDGARLGYGLAAPDTDLCAADFASLTDVFYIGGTKVGAMFGEAVVFCGIPRPAHFTAQVKQHGALLAKGRFLGLQFDVLFTDGLYEEISRHAISCAEKLRTAFHDKGYRFYIESHTNQIFIILENAQMEHLSRSAAFSFWERYDENHTVVRFATSWATRAEAVDELAALL